MKNQFNFQQSIHSILNLSEATSEPATCSTRTADHSKNALSIANNANMGKCLSICKEPKKPFLSNSESPADAQSSPPDRNDPPRILTTTPRAVACIDTTNSAKGGTLALTNNAKHVGHFGVTFISMSPADHVEESRGEQTLKLEANKAQELDRGEKEQQGNMPPAVFDSENVNCKLEENFSERRQRNRDPPPSDTAEDSPNEGHSSGEDGISPQRAPSNHRLPNANSERAGSQHNQGNYQSSTQFQPRLQDQKDGNRDLQNEDEDINEAANSVSAESGETPGKPDLSTPWTSLCSMLQRKERLSSGPEPESVKERSMQCHGLHRLLEISRRRSCNIYVATHVQNVTEVDILCPGVLDGPPMQLTIPSKPEHLASFTDVSLPAIQVLRLPRLQSCKSFDLDTFLYDVAQNSSGLEELVFEDAGQISKRSATSLANNKSLKKLEVYDPKVPLLRALTIGCSELEGVCFYGLAMDVERDLCLYLRQKGASLKSLSLNFSLSVRQARWMTGQKEFFGRMLAFLDISVPNGMSGLHTLEVSSCPSYDIKHGFNAPGPTSTSAAAELHLGPVDAMIRKKHRAHHPKQSIITLTKIKLRGHLTAVTDSLRALSWVNQDSMEIEVELPGVSAIYLRGFGLMKPVILTFLQLDQFISQGWRSPWLELTALREIDLGGTDFVQEYNSDIAPIRAATRTLLVTSRESLSRVRICYKIPTRDIFVETCKILGQIVPLTPLVSHLDISRDIVLHASLEDYEYVDTIMLLRRWNLKTVQLVSSKNYGTVETGMTETNADKHVTEEFVRKLPAFLTILAAACPKVENLVVEYDEVTGGWNDCPKKGRLVADALKALEVYEKVGGTVRVGTLRGQLHAWESVLETDES